MGALGVRKRASQCLLDAFNGCSWGPLGHSSGLLPAGHPKASEAHRKPDEGEKAKTTRGFINVFYLSGYLLGGNFKTLLEPLGNMIWADLGHEKLSRPVLDALTPGSRPRPTLRRWG